MAPVKSDKGKPEEKSEKTVESTEENKPKRGRGRPKGTFKKNKKKTPAKKPYDGPKRGRGRPKKVAE